MGTLGIEGTDGRRFGKHGRWIALVVTLGIGACGAGEEKTAESLRVEELEAYWTVKGERAGNNYISPIVRFKIRNGGQSDADYIQTMAVFRLESSPNDAWGNAYEYAIAGDPVAPGELSRLITLRCDSTFFSTDSPRQMIDNEQWEQVFVEIFLRVGSSTWKSVHNMEVPRRLGAPGIEKFLEPQEESEPAPGEVKEGKNRSRTEKKS